MSKLTPPVLIMLRPYQIIYYEDNLIPYSLHYSDKISSLLAGLQSLIAGCQEVFTPETVIDGKTLINALLEIFATIKTMGPFCAKELSEIFAKEIGEIIVNSKDSRFAAVISGVLSFFQYLQVILRVELSHSFPYQQLQANVSGKMFSILKVLYDFATNMDIQSTEPAKNPSGLNGIIFAKSRTTVRLLAIWLDAVANYFEDFKFLKVGYLVQNIKQVNTKEAFPLTSRLESMLYKYRKNEVNLLVVDCFYEELLDVSKCNLVIRYDFPETFAQYVNSKQKLRADDGIYILFIPSHEPKRSECEHQLCEFVSAEDMRNKELETQRPPPFDTLVDLYPPYITVKEATVDLVNALNVLNRYCARLPSDTFTRLVPIYSYQTVEDGKILCTIHLPINSPVRDPITGLPSDYQDIAQRSAAIHACKALHLAGELNDHLFPAGKENIKCLEELGIKRCKRSPKGENSLQERQGSNKRRRSYKKRVAEALKGGDIIPGEPCYMYTFLMSLTFPIPEEQNTRGRKLVDPMDSPLFFGLLTRSKISRICDFPIYTRSGEVLVSMKLAAENVIFNANEIEKIKQFHRFTFTDVLHLVKDPMVYAPAEAPSSILVLPVNYKSSSKDITSSFKIDSDSVTIDWNFIDKVLLYEKTDSFEHKGDFKFDRKVFEDAVVKPWYRCANEQLHFYVADICANLKPTSQFPTESYPTFYDYYLSKYKIQITDKDQPLLDVDHTSARLNFLVPRFVNRKGMPLPKSTEKTRTAKRENLQSKQLLVPELCIVHPFSASYWNKAVCLPSILYRINHLLIADQLRRKVATDIGIGVINDDPDFTWPKLDFGWSLTEILNQSFTEDKVEHGFEMIKTSKKPETSESSTHVSESSPLSNVTSSPSAVPLPNPKNVPVEPSSNVTTESFDELLIDTFDPNIYKVENNYDDDELGDIQPVGNWDNHMHMDRAFEIDPIRNWSRIEDELRVVELDENNHPITSRDTFRCGSPSNFDLNGDSNNSNWVVQDPGLNTIIDLEIPELNLISSAAGVDMEKLSKDLENIHAFDDFDDSEDEDESGMFDEDIDDHLDEDQLFIPDSDEKIVSNKEEASKDILSSGLLLSSQCDSIKLEESSILDRMEISESWINEKIISSVQMDKKKVVSIFSIDDMSKETPKEECSNVKEIVSSVETDVEKVGTISSIDELSTDFAKDECIGEKEIIPSVETDNKKVGSIDKMFTGTSSNDNIWEEKEMKEKEITIEEIISKLKESLTLIQPVPSSSKSNDKDFSIKSANISLANRKQELVDIYPSFGELLPNRDEIRVESEKNNDPNTNCIHLDPLNEEFDPDVGPSPAMVLQALTMSNASDGINLERLETVGDSFLKYAVTVFMYCRCPNHEGILSYLRSTQISNSRLYELGSDKNLGELMVATKFEPSENWLPPGFKIPEKLSKTSVIKCDESDGEEKLTSFNCLLTQQSIPDKSIADCVEALIGAYLISCGTRGALLFMRWLGIMVMDDVKELQHSTGLWRWLNPIKSPLLSLPAGNDLWINLEGLYSLYNLHRFEKEIIQYEFKDKAYLVQAFTHNSFSDNRVTDCYQRLEFLGDAVLDFLITRHLYDDPRQHSPGVLTDLRSALANNTFFASLAVEYEFHKYLMYKTDDLHKVIAKFVDYHGSGGKIKDPAAYSLLLGEGDCEQPEDIEVPKALGDVFESVAGAIYLDSGFSLNTVWRVYHRMMGPEIEYYSKNPPKSPIRELLEMKPQKVAFSKSEAVIVNGITKMRICVEVFGVGKYYGIGRHRRLAKYTAAKRALRDLKTSNKCHD